MFFCCINNCRVLFIVGILLLLYFLEFVRKGLGGIVIFWLSISGKAARSCKTS